MLVDDLTTRGTDEPYSHADLARRVPAASARGQRGRSPAAHPPQSVSSTTRAGARSEAWQAGVAAAHERASPRSWAPTAVNNSSRVSGRRRSRTAARRLAELYRRPELDWRAIEADPRKPEGSRPPRAKRGGARARRGRARLPEGYLRRQEAEAARLARADSVRVPDTIDYRGIPGLSNEAVEKLEAIRPRSVGQASRISGITPAAIAILLTHIGLKKKVERRSSCVKVAFSMKLRTLMI